MDICPLAEFLNSYLSFFKLAQFTCFPQASIQIVELMDHVLSTYDRVISNFTSEQFKRQGAAARVRIRRDARTACTPSVWRVPDVACSMLAPAYARRRASALCPDSTARCTVAATSCRARATPVPNSHLLA
jgi:hypothetical protein